LLVNKLRRRRAAIKTKYKIFRMESQNHGLCGIILALALALALAFQWLGTNFGIYMPKACCLRMSARLYAISELVCSNICAVAAYSFAVQELRLVEQVVSKNGPLCRPWCSRHAKGLGEYTMSDIPGKWGIITNEEFLVKLCSFRIDCLPNLQHRCSKNTLHLFCVSCVLLTSSF
jgi:hypothetical protein